MVMLFRWGWLWLWCLSAACGDEKQPSAPVPERLDAAAEDASEAHTMQCGSVICEPPPQFMGEQPCCADPFSGDCGVMLEGTCYRYSERDPRCPAATPDGVMGEEAEAMGVIPCCASNGECGIDLGSGFGCIAPSQACGLYPRDLVELLGSQTCEGEQLELPDDCGVGP